MIHPYILNTRLDIFNLIPKNSIIGEIGVFKGDFSKLIFETSNPKELHLIDLFDGITMSGNKDGQNIISTNLTNEYIYLQEYFNNHSHVFLHKGKSTDTLMKFTDHYFDILYVDGDHSYSGVLSDLELALIKTKKNGIISGHDYHIHTFPEVYSAVNDFCYKYNLQINYITQDLLPSYVITLL